jgi:hypothetical protein
MGNTKRRIKTTCTAALGIALVLAAPGVTNGAQAVAARPPVLATCSGPSHWVVSQANNLRFYSQKSITSPWGTVVQRGDEFFCDTMELGGRYTACGVSNGNGWIMVRDYDYNRKAYVYQACVADI